MKGNSLTLSEMSDGRIVEGRPVIPYVAEECMGERNPGGTYTIHGRNYLVTMPPEVARRIAAHIMETDDHDN